MYGDGQGVPKNNNEAMKWCRLAAEQGDANAQTVLGLEYIVGGGVPVDHVRAYFWLNLAAAQGNEIAKNSRDSITTRLTKEQIAEAQRMSAAWQPKAERQ